MAATFTRLRSRLEDSIGSDSFRWFDRSYLLDWSIAGTAWFAAWIIKELPPFESEFNLKDPAIDYKHHSNQIGSGLNWTIALILPLTVTVAVGCIRRSAIEVHHSCLALWAGRGYAYFFTESLKNRVGRLRPDFLDRCKWDKTLKACAGNLDKVLDGRRSFPSGHSSTAFAGMTFLSFWIAGMTGAWCINQPASSASLLSSKLARLSLSIIPLLFATWVAISRVEDNRHHIEDVIVGSLIGITSAAICYLIYWPNPFTSQIAEGEPGAARAKSVYRDRNTDRSGNNYGYELTGMDHERGTELV
ncbi:putative lipid phosphate phosphatase 3, chloroplastic [Grifola frondosa]|uniref:Putative lipid phosphate phosphatase 3, chloroplastic n=1 Tax=Grifola frondosa TaxID=5627 RepID=A0A1C7MA21_GRIFR|nr:putative lipid phosphate phosphatase 3, chloroplastic [Grifola frondosa]